MVVLYRPLESSSAPASLKEQKPATQAAGDDRPLLNHSHLNGGGHHLAEELSVQHTSNSNSSLGGESACSLVNNDSLGLDERGIFKQFDERNRWDVPWWSFLVAVQALLLPSQGLAEAIAVHVYMPVCVRVDESISCCLPPLKARL